MFKVIRVDQETLAEVVEQNGIAVISYYKLATKCPVPPGLTAEVLEVYRKPEAKEPADESASYKDGDKR